MSVIRAITYQGRKSIFDRGQEREEYRGEIINETVRRDSFPKILLSLLVTLHDATVTLS